jgi:FixJ family two-component response regulator
MTADVEFGPVAVVDDDASQAQTMGFQLEDVGLEPLVVDLDEVRELDGAASWLTERVGSLICDVQLKNLHPGMKYHGAQLVANLIAEARMPCVLTTGFTQDVGMLVRPYRRNIPVLLSREETEDPETLLDGLQRCQAELSGSYLSDRRTHRTSLFIERAGQAEGGVALDAQVGGWPHKTPMRFPAAMLGEQYAERGRADELIGKVFFAKVNVGASREPDLYFEDPEAEFVDAADLNVEFG